MASFFINKTTKMLKVDGIPPRVHCFGVDAPKMYPPRPAKQLGAKRGRGEEESSDPLGEQVPSSPESEDGGIGDLATMLTKRARVDVGQPDTSAAQKDASTQTNNTSLVLLSHVDMLGTQVESLRAELASMRAELSELKQIIMCFASGQGLGKYVPPNPSHADLHYT